jgi:large subunit ribosomal protein L25
MSDINLLKGEVRESIGKASAKTARKSGMIPCIVYGDEKDPVSISINYISALKLYNTGRMLTTLLDLELSNGDKMKVIPKEIQIDPVKDNIIHIDMLRLAEDARVSVEIQVNFIGEDDSPGIKTGGVLTVTRYSVELDCPAIKIPESIDVDISNLNMGESVKLSDVTLPEDVNPVITDRDITIASVTAPVEEVEEEIIEEESEEGEEGAEGEEGTDGESDSAEETKDDDSGNKEEGNE